MNWKPETRNREIETENWRTETGNSVTGNRKTGSRKPKPGNPKPQTPNNGGGSSYLESEAGPLEKGVVEGESVVVVNRVGRHATP